MRITASLLSSQKQQNIEESLQSSITLPPDQFYILALVEQSPDDVDAGQGKNGLLLLLHLEIAKRGAVYTLQLFL